MRKLLLIGAAVAVVGLLIVGFATPIFAQNPDDGGVTPADEEAWADMHEACENGDWEAMIGAAERVHGEDFSDMPCHDEEGYTTAGGWGMMGGGMTGGGMYR